MVKGISWINWLLLEVHQTLWNDQFTLNSVTQERLPFHWSATEQTAFEVLKQAFVQAPGLAVLDFQIPFVVEMDVNDIGFEAVLMQDGHPISYLSKPLYGRNKALSTYEKECMAVLVAIEKWRPYLQSQQFIIRTDHRSLLFLIEEQSTTRLQQKVMIKLMYLNFKIQYKKGSTNNAANALSICQVAEEQVFSVSLCVPAWLERL